MKATFSWRSSDRWRPSQSAECTVDVVAGVGIRCFLSATRPPPCPSAEAGHNVPEALCSDPLSRQLEIRRRGRRAVCGATLTELMTLMAREAVRYLAQIAPQIAISTLTCRGAGGAGDGNRARMTSFGRLGTRPGSRVSLWL
jgi:hypothetical protein